MGNKGISLISLVITIVVIIILASIVSVSGDKNTEEAFKVRFQNDLKNVVTALNVYHERAEIHTEEDYNKNNLSWDGVSERAMNTAKIEDKDSGEEDTIKYIFSDNVPKTLKGLIRIKDGKIVVDETRKPEVEWAEELYTDIGGSMQDVEVEY